MTEPDEPDATTRKRRKRRPSLRVPVDEVPQQTRGADSDETGTGGAAADDWHAAPGDASAPRGAPDGALLDEADDAIETLEELDESLLGAPRTEDAGAPLELERTVVAALAQAFEEQAVEAAAIGGEADARETDPDELSREADDHFAQAVRVEHDPMQSASAPEARPPEADSPESASGDTVDTDALSASGPIAEPRTPEPAMEPPPKPAGVIVQRVVAVVSAPRSTEPSASDENGAASEPLHGTELALELDDASAAEPETGDLVEELDVDVDEGEAPGVAHALELPGERDSTPELALEDADALLEEEEARAEGDPKRPSKPPPPPPTQSKVVVKDGPATPAEPAAVAAPPAQLPQLEPTKRKKSRRNWWEELFNDDYLRTVPIPHPRVIAKQCDFIEQRFGLAPGATILDVGCGLGLHAVELTRRGYVVVGLDLSLSMLARAADEAQDSGFKINFLHADMREMTFDGVFDAVLCYGTTFGYFDDETNKLVVERLYRALKPRGLLLLDVVNRDFVIRNQPNLVWFEGDGCVVMEESQMNYITSRLEVKRTVILDNGRQRENFYSLRTYSLHELGQILHHQGFRVVEVTGWEAHPGVFFGGDSPKLIILAERRPQGPPVPKGRTPSGEMEAVSVDDAAIPVASQLPEPPETPEPVVRATSEPPLAPSPAVHEALAEALERAAELDPSRSVEPVELDPAELDEDLDEPES